ncbi:glycosyltransferase family 4 protein [Paracoccus sp. SCSIO 75233]|uniref:glycosyltransferase family 4 protein n=1 Tax=Paracoccus sp. SCSIO 75233 TaxID=3017782 RepID=UPI0022F09FCE|nr:glycosyltransferase family 4 protein [Paracoccus sp. SCSIO 75233]WBU52620.1 glycosyltransferase family 4 protein [Paracoccus sp. SCSIO 75233]
MLHKQAGEIGDYARDLGLSIEVAEDLPLMRTREKSREGDVGVSAYLTLAIRKMMREIRRIDPQIVHTNEGRIHTNWALPTRLSGRRHVWHHRQDPRAFGVNKIAPLLADKIVSVSAFSRPAKPIRPVDGKFIVVRSPFDFKADIPDKSACRDKIIAELGLPANAILLGWFGVLIERKKPVRFVEVVAEVQRSFPDRQVHGLLFGGTDDTDHSLPDDCRSRADTLGISDHVHLMGFRQPLADYMAGVDLSIVTALSEPFGRTLIESMHFGTPVIATHHGGNPEAITDGVNGFLVPAEQPSAFVTPVRELLTNSALYDRIVEAARSDLTEKYGRDTHIRKISEVYDQLISPSPS